MQPEADIHFETRGHVGLVTLNRGHALNALTHRMVLDLGTALDRWESDPAIAHVIIRSHDEKAFSAGGDIRDLYEKGLSARRGEGEKPIGFFRDEYRLNLRIRTYSKPYVALIDGIVMGGGVGVSINGSHRLAGANIRFAMPEVGIGFFPDVGATWFLPRLPGETGTWLALTGAQMDQADCCWSGIATQGADAERFDELIEALAVASETDAVLAEFRVEPANEPSVAPHQEEISRIFAGDRLQEIEARLAAAGSGNWPGAEKAARAMSRMSPTSLAIALKQMRFGKRHEFADCMKTEFRIVSRILDGVDFYEGVRAQIIDKDRKPVWKPAHLAELDDTVIEGYFAPLDAQADLATIMGR